MTAQAHYAALFSSVERDFGPAATETLTAVIGFTAGGPVSVCRFGSEPVYVTCELSLNPEQVLSAEGVRFELMSRLPLSEYETQDFLTGLGAFSLEARLGDRHTIDVSAAFPGGGIQVVRLQLYTTCEIGGTKYGIYEVCNAA